MKSDASGSSHKNVVLDVHGETQIQGKPRRWSTLKWLATGGLVIGSSFALGFASGTMSPLAPSRRALTNEPTFRQLFIKKQAEEKAKQQFKNDQQSRVYYLENEAFFRRMIEARHPNSSYLEGETEQEFEKRKTEKEAAIHKAQRERDIMLENERRENERLEKFMRMKKVMNPAMASIAEDEVDLEGLKDCNEFRPRAPPKSTGIWRRKAGKWVPPPPPKGAKGTWSLIEGRWTRTDKPKNLPKPKKCPPPAPEKRKINK